MEEPATAAEEESIPLIPHIQDRQLNDEEGASNNENREKLRNLIGFFILGICAEFAVNWILAAAFDILELNKPVHTSGFYCHSNSAGLVLMAGVIPEFLVRLICPWFMQAISYHMRFMVVIVTSVTGVLLLGLSHSTPVALFGVVMGAISAAMLEITCLSFSSHFHKKVVPLYAAGTAASGILASLLYAGVTTAGMPPRSAMFLLLLSPLSIAMVFWVVIELPEPMRLSLDSFKISCAWRSSVESGTKNLTLKDKTKLVIPLLKNIIPLFLIYVATFLTNQALYELLYYKVKWLTQAKQYRWFEFAFYIGESIGKLLLLLFRVKHLFIPTSVAIIIFVVFLLEVMYTYIPSIWLTLVIIVFEGICSGSVYANAIYNVTNEVSLQYREFSMGLVTVADAAGATLAAAISLPLHKGLCSFKKRMKKL